jgi:hypothetical protein
MNRVQARNADPSAVSFTPVGSRVVCRAVDPGRRAARRGSLPKVSGPPHEQDDLTAPGRVCHFIMGGTNEPAPARPVIQGVAVTRH